MATVDDKVKSWPMTKPGLVTEASPAGVLQKAWGASGVQCSLGDFTDALWRWGFKPEQVGARWQLALPSDPTGGADMDRHRRLHNLM